MGTRRNIKMMQDGGTAMFFYQHWDGDELPSTLQSALKRGKERWDDEPYLGRIIFSEMIAPNPMELTGFGLTTYPTDGTIICTVDASKKTVEYKGKTYSFDEYCELSLSE